MRISLIYIIIILYAPIKGFSQSNEYTLKAGFIEKFARFSDWPENSMGTTFKIGVIGKSPLNSELETLYNNYKIKNKPVEIIYLQSIKETKTCQIVFIGTSSKDKLNTVLTEIQNLPILTIADTKGYAKKGVIINFYHTAQETIHFEINTTALKKTNIKIDLMLLDFAKIIE